MSNLPTKVIFGVVLALLLVGVSVSGASAAGKTCYSDSNGAVTAGHVSCPIALRVLHKASQHYSDHGLGVFRVRVNGVWHCNSSRVYHPSSILTTCKRGEAFVVIVARS